MLSGQIIFISKHYKGQRGDLYLNEHAQDECTETTHFWNFM